MSPKPLEILLLCDYRENIAATVREHIDSLIGFSRHHVRKVSILGDLPSRLDLNHFDVVIVHYSLIACHNSYISVQARAPSGPQMARASPIRWGTMAPADSREICTFWNTERDLRSA